MLKQISHIRHFSLVFFLFTLLFFVFPQTSWATPGYSSNGLVVVSHEIATTGDITGYIRNDSRTSYTNVVIKIDLFDEKGIKIDRISGYTGASLLRGHNQSRFDVPIPEKYRGKFKTYQIFAVIGTPKYEPKFLSN